MIKKEENRIENSLIPWLGKTVKLIDNNIDDILFENNIDLSRQQFIVLKNIIKNEGITQNELAFFANRNKSSLTRMIAILERKGYVIKHHCKNDKRKFKLKISDLGLEVIEEATPYFSEFVNRLENDISKEEKKLIQNILEKIQNNIIGEGTSPFFKVQK
jgi:DNA-binding MarR family transcriptional regulator